MPIITLETGSLSEEQKKQLIAELTQVSAKITGIPEQSFIVLLKEIADENVGVGGKTLTEVKKNKLQS